MEVMSSDSDSRGLLAAAMVQDIDVLVISSSLDEDPQRGCLVLREPRASRPDTRAVVLLDSSRRETILDAFRAGAKGIFNKNESVETLAKCGTRGGFRPHRSRIFPVISPQWSRGRLPRKAS
jgi:DNA-binding NarL/FixJ family response regulator